MNGWLAAPECERFSGVVQPLVPDKRVELAGLVASAVEVVCAKLRLAVGIVPATNRDVRMIPHINDLISVDLESRWSINNFRVYRCMVLNSMSCKQN